MTTQREPLDDMTLSYLECALWLLTDEDGETTAHSIEDVAPESVEAARSDCADFREAAGDLLDEWSDEQAGHDFWLTRNGHGAGFWDRGKDAGDELTELCKPYGGSDAYVGDDGKVYLS